MRYLLYNVYFVVLEYTFRVFIFPIIIIYSDFAPELNPWKYLLSLLILNACLLSARFLKEDTQRFVLDLITYLLLVPSLVMLIDVNPNIWIVPSILILYIAYITSSNLFDFKTSFTYLEISPMLIMFIILIMLVPFIMAFGVKFDPSVFLLENVYEVRLDARTKDNYFTGRFYGILTNVFIPFLFVRSLEKKRWLGIIFAVLVTLYLFTTAAQKLTLFSLILILVFWNVKSLKRFINGTIIVTTVACLFTCWLYFVKEDLISSIAVGNVVDRVLVAPSWLHVLYFDFFSKNGYTYFSIGPLSFLLGDLYPFFTYPAEIIGQLYYGSLDMHANTGFPSDGFLQLGIIGVTIYALIESFIFLAFAKILKNNYAYIPILIINLFNVLSTDVFTALFTHGVIVFLFFVYLVKLK